MNVIVKLYATVFGIGYIKGGGTVAAALYCVLYYYLPLFDYPVFLVTSAVLILVIGIGASNYLEREWGKDSGKIVIDEFSGMQIGLLFIAPEPQYIIAGLIMFRFFDIAKPLYIRKAEKLPKGWGVMLDDVMAGIYTNILLHLLSFLIGDSQCALF